MPPHPIELRRVERTRRPQRPRQQREPAVPSRQHLGDQPDQLTPALIADGERALDRRAERVRALVRKGAPRGFLVGRKSVIEQIEPAAGARGDGELRGQPGVEGIDGLDAQARGLALDIDAKRPQMRSRAERQLPGFRVESGRTLRKRGGAERADDTPAHLFCGHPRERQREDPLGRIDGCEKPQVALRQQGGLAAAGRRLHQHRPQVVYGMPTRVPIDRCVPDHASSGGSSSASVRSSVEGTLHSPCR